MSLIEDFVRIFQVAPAMVPYIDFVAEPAEMELVVKVGHQKLTLELVADLLEKPVEEVQPFVHRAYCRHILDRETIDGVHVYTSGTFYRRLDPLTMYENWGDVPEEARKAVVQWELDEFIEKWQPAIQEILKDPDAEVQIPNRDVLLLNEALAQVEAATDIAVVPCDCRTQNMACQRPVEGCFRFNDGAIEALGRGMGRRLTTEEGKQLLIELDRAGLMHTGARDAGEGQHYGFCSCCACDCYPIRAGIALGLEQHWPRSHYVAQLDRSKCKLCGKCTTRCHFQAFYFDGVDVTAKGKSVKHLAFDAAKCWGCGLCATTCSSEAISMQPLDGAREARS